MDIESMGENCNNTGWQHWADKSGTPHVGHTVGDRIACKFMVTAILFMTNWSESWRKDEQETQNNKKLRQYMRCAIVNMFGTILTESACGGHWGIYYAGYSVRKMMGDGGIPMSASATECARERMQDIRRGKWSMQQAVKEWLRKNVNLQQMIQRTQLQQECKKKIQQGPMQQGAVAATEQKATTEPWVLSAQQTLQRALKRVLQKVEREISVKGAHDPDEQESDEQDILRDTDNADEQNTEIEDGQTAAEAPKDTTPEAAPEEKTSQDPQGGKEAGKGKAEQNPGKEADDDPVNVKLPGSSGKMSVTVIDSYDSGKPSDEIIKQYEEKGNLPSGGPDQKGESKRVHKSSDSSEKTQSTESKETTSGKEPVASPAGPTTTTTNTTTGPETKSTGTGGDGRTPDQKDAVVVEGNDDPPPLNPPKPKPETTNPDQSGSSGSFSHADLADGVSGGEGKGGEGDEKDAGGGGRCCSRCI
ncbi:hypothetical protein AK88_04148 [Plasmodium fragile]|uniref:Uncharacterized protein n=1 Tax=Plasmodium fragile TaxID=5857 RepID=A0A0D9QHB7_PLAFR|nr:uncharacterized protein AK88_04148 [Plasmodium fragile]KJP86177.1 hypothetical protein AK88_04148 [Plasmodium fragile]